VAEISPLRSWLGSGLALLLVAACLGDVGVRPAGAGSGGDGGAADAGDALLPWEDPPAYYAQWTHGPSSDPAFFPIAVWLQSPSNAAAFAAIGINTFIGLYQGPTDSQLTDLQAASLVTLCDQGGVYASHLNDSTIRGWTQDDEPDNAQPDGSGGYGPCIDPSVIQARYAAFRANDATRPVYLNLGQGVAWDDWVGRGSACAGRLDMYPQYELGADIVSFDIYPVNETDPAVKGDLSLVAKGVDRLRQWSGYTRPVWNWIETTGFNDPANTPTPQQVRAEVWMSLVHGSAGIGYFVHIFEPTFIEAGLLANPTLRSAVAQLNAEIQSLAPVLNTASIANAVTVVPENASVVVDVMVKRQGGALYVFAVAMQPGTTEVQFTLRQSANGTATVIGESRTLTVTAGAFGDTFSDRAVHLYRLSL
jgi:hypothetical protein